MEISEKFVTDKLASLQQQLAQNSQMFLQAQANVNAVQGAIQSTTEMLNYIRQKTPVALPEKDIMDVTTPEVSQ